MDSIGDLLQDKADKLDLKRGDDLQIIQIELDRIFGASIASASQITERSELIVKTKLPEKMTEIRFAYLQIMDAIRNQTDREINRIIVRLKN